MAPVGRESAASSGLDDALARARRPHLRRDGDVELPAGPKAVRTRARLLETARSVVARRGYQATSVQDIVDAAGVSFGTFYQYFRDRTDILTTLIVEHVAHLLDAASPWTAPGRADDLGSMIGRFVEAYAASAEMAKVWEEASLVNPEVAAMRRELGRRLTDGVERELLRGSRAGRTRRLRADEAAMAARALTGMVDRFCFVTYVFDPPPDGPPDPSEAARLLTELWAASIGLRTD